MNNQYFNKVIFVKVKLLLVVFFVSFATYAGDINQKLDLQTIIDSPTYENLFKHYTKDTQQFTYTVLEDELAIAELVDLFSSVQYERTLPYFVSNDSKVFVQGMDARVENQFPWETYKRLWQIALERENPWKALTVTESASLIANAALTGPKFGLDVLSGGFSKIGKGISTTGKAFKRIKVVKNIKKIDNTLSAGNLAKITRILKRLDVKAARRLNLTSAEATKIARMFDSDAFRLFQKILEMTKDHVILLNDLSNTDKALIQKYLNDNKNDATDILSQYFTSLVSDTSVEVATQLNNAKIAFYIRLFQTGLLSIMSDDEDAGIALAKAAMDVSLKAMEFVPLAGPFVELANANRAALSTIKNRQRESLEAAELYTESRIAYIDKELNIYRLMVLEGIIHQIFNNDYVVKDSLDLEEYFGASASINNIAGSIYEYGGQKVRAKSIYDDYRTCLISFKRNFDTKSEVTNVNRNISSKINAKCSVKDGYYIAKVKSSRGNYDEKYDVHLELYITLNDRKLFKLPMKGGYLDVTPNSFYYPYIKLLAFKNIINSKTDYFYPSRNLTEFQLIVLITNAFYFDSFQQYRTINSGKSELQLYFDFIKNKVGWTADINSSDSPVYRKDIADIMYLVFRREYSLAQPASYIDGTQVTWLLNGVYYSGVTDMSKGWNYSTLFLKSIGVATGYVDGDFRRMQYINRAESAVLLYKAVQFMEQNQ